MFSGGSKGNIGKKRVKSFTRQNLFLEDLRLERLKNFLPVPIHGGGKEKKPMTLSNNGVPKENSGYDRALRKMVL